MLTEGLLIAVVTALAAVLVELVRNRRRQDRVVHEVTPNGGSSLKDQVGRIEAVLAEMRDEIGELREGRSRNAERIAALEAVAGTPPGGRRGMWR